GADQIALLEIVSPQPIPARGASALTAGDFFRDDPYAVAEHSVPGIRVRRFQRTLEVRLSAADFEIAACELTRGIHQLLVERPRYAAGNRRLLRRGGGRCQQEEAHRNQSS